MANSYITLFNSSGYFELYDTTAHELEYFFAEISGGVPPSMDEVPIKEWLNLVKSNPLSQFEIWSFESELSLSGLRYYVFSEAELLKSAIKENGLKLYSNEDEANDDQPAEALYQEWQ